MNNFAFNSQLPLWSFRLKSSSKVQIITRKEIETRLFRQCFKDDSFRNELLENPKTEIERMFDIVLPDGISIQVLEETEREIYLVIPQNPYKEMSEIEIREFLGIGVEEVAQLVLEQQTRPFTENKEKNADLIAKVWKNPQFKRLLISDPNLLLEQELSEKIDKSYTITVLEESAEQIFVVIPYLSDGIMDEKELQSSFINLPMIVGSFKGTPVCTQHICFTTPQCGP